MTKTYIIAEAGVNHNGSMDLAMQLVDAAVVAGADAIKFQTFKADKLVSRNAPKAQYQQRTTDKAETQYDMLKKLELDEHAHMELMNYCHQRGIQFLSTPFDLDSVYMLTNQLNLPTMKVSSGDLTNAPLLYAIAQSNKAIIVSTGMSTLGEIEQALSVLALGYTNPIPTPHHTHFQQAYASERGQHALQQKVTLLHCTTEYPAPLEEVNLRAMETLRHTFHLPVGYSDHTEGIAIPIAAVAMGATVIEKHITIDRTLPGPDHKASIEPHELAELVRSIRMVEQALGSNIKHATPSEIRNKAVARKSIVATTDILAGAIFSAENITVKRPGDGIEPIHYWSMLGTKAVKSYKKDDVIT